MKKVFFPLLLLSLLGNITTTTSSSLATTEASTTETTTITTDSLLDTSLIEESLAESSTSESTQVSSSENVTGESGSEESSGGESSESTVEKPKMQSLAATTSLDLATQDGSEGNPYLVATFAELQSAIDTINKKTDDSQSLYYIQLTADIEYTNKTTTLSKSTVINGIKDLEKDPADPDNHYSILYTTSSGYTSRHFEATGAVNITLKNINYGNEEYPNGNYWGIMRMNTSYSSLTVENIQYNLANGSQPFYADDHYIRLTFKGKNSFISNQERYGGEFVQAFSDILFSKDSVTKVVNDNSAENALFYATKNSSVAGNYMNLTIETNAVLDLKTSQNGLFWADGDVNVSIGENSFFKYEKFLGNGNKTDNYINATAKEITFEFQKGSSGEFLSSSTNLDVKNNTIFNFAQPDYILFQNTNNLNVLRGTATVFNRKDTMQNLTYAINYMDSTNITQSFNNHVAPNDSITIIPSDFNGVQSLIYEQTLSLTGVSGTPNASVSEKQSQIEADIDGFVPNNCTLTSVDYLLSKKSLHVDGDMNSNEVQQTINGAFNSNDSSYLRKTVTLTTENTDTSTIFENLAGGDYYLYARATGEVTEGFPSTTLWVTTASEPLSLAKVINTNIPVNMIFKSPTTEFGKAENAGKYTFINNSNIPIAVDLTEVAPTAESDSAVSLATALAPTDTYKLLLNLATNYTDETNNPLVWGPLTEGPISEDSKAMLLEPFWETDKNQAEVYLTGNYSGPVSEVKNVAYNFTFTINAQEETENAN